MELKRVKIVMLSTNNKAKGLYLGASGKLYYSVNPNQMIPEYYYPQHLYIISETEKIKVNDLYYSKGIDLVCKAIIFPLSCKDAKKIIASTNLSLNLPTLSDSFISKYIKEYNSGNIIEDVLVEQLVDYSIHCEYTREECSTLNGGSSGCELCSKAYWKLKINPKDNSITIRKN